MKHTKLFVGALLMMATLIACETALPPVEGPPPPMRLEAISATEKTSDMLSSSNAACIQPTISLGAVTIWTRSGEPKTTAPGINDLIRVEVTADADAPNYMWGIVKITDSGGADHEVTYLFYPNASTAGYGKPAHYVRGELAEGRTVSFEITEAHVFRSGDNCLSTDSSTTVRTALPEPAEVAPTVIAGAGTAEVPPTTGGVARSVAGSGRMHWARLQWDDEVDPPMLMNPPVWLYRRSGLYADGKWHELTTGGLAELYVTPIKLGPLGTKSLYNRINAQTCRLFVDTQGRELRGEFLDNRRPFGRYYRLDRIEGTQASPQVFELDQWRDTLVVNGGQTLNVAMICRDSWQGEAL